MNHSEKLRVHVDVFGHHGVLARPCSRLGLSLHIRGATTQSAEPNFVSAGWATALFLVAVSVVLRRYHQKLA
jgi:hypothetical protein